MSISEVPRQQPYVAGGSYRLQAQEVTAHQWCRNGDHPKDNCRMIAPTRPGITEPFLSEGEVVRYFRHPDVSGDSQCSLDCGATMHHHGWIDQGITGRTVCPGDVVVGLPRPAQAGEVAYFPLKPDVFMALCEPATT